MRRKLFKKDRFCLLQTLLFTNLAAVLLFGLLSHFSQNKFPSSSVDENNKLVEALDSKWLPPEKEKSEVLNPVTVSLLKTPNYRTNESSALDLNKFNNSFIATQDLFGCDYINKIKIIKRLGKGTSKEVHLGKLFNKVVAVKQVTSSVEDVTACTRRKRYWKVEDCFLYANYKILKEILIRKQLNHQGLLRLLGYCVRSERISKTLSEHGVVSVTEVGSPLVVNSIKSWTFKRKLELVEGLADTLDYLEHSPLGSLLLTDFKLSQMFIVDDILKIGDLDDINNLEKQCTFTSECLIERKNFGILCKQFICQDYNAKFNLYKFYQLIISKILLEPPKSVEKEISEVLTDLKELKITARELHSRIEKLGKELIDTTEPKENSRKSVTTELNESKENSTSGIKSKQKSLLILDLLQQTELNLTCQGIFTVIKRQFKERISKEEHLMKVVGWKGYSDKQLYHIIEEGIIMVKNHRLIKEQENFEIGLNINQLPATFKVAPAKTYGERHIAQLAFFITDRILGMYLTMPTKGKFLEVDTLTSNGRAPAMSKLASQMSKEIKNGSLPGTVSISLRGPWQERKTFITDKLDTFPAILGQKLNRRAKRELEFRMLMWITGSPFISSKIRKIQEYPIAYDNYKSFRVKNEDQLNYFNHCQFPKLLVEILRFMNSSSQKNCQLSNILIEILTQDLLKPKLEDFGINVGFKTKSLLTMDEYADTLLKIVDRCVNAFGEENVLY